MPQRVICVSYPPHLGYNETVALITPTGREVDGRAEVYIVIDEQRRTPAATAPADDDPLVMLSELCSIRRSVVTGCMWRPAWTDPDSGVSTPGELAVYTSDLARIYLVKTDEATAIGLMAELRKSKS